jgi:alpha,alpha-trehalase
MGIWSLEYKNYDPSLEKLREALCTTGNGYFATRGAAPESKAGKFHYPGTYIAGCYNRVESRVRSQKLEHESLVNAPNWLPLTFRIGKERWFKLENVEILDYQEKLSLLNGVLIRKVRFKDRRGGRITRIVERRFVHMEFPHLAGIQTTILAENWQGPITILSALDGTVKNSGIDRYRDLNSDHLYPDEQHVSEDNIQYLSVLTNQSRIRISEAAKTTVRCRGSIVKPKRSIVRPKYVGQEFLLDLKKGEPVLVEKLVSLYTSKDLAISECGLASRNSVLNAPDFSKLVGRQAMSWDHLWRRFKISIKGDNRAALDVHTHIFHLLQTVSPNTIDRDAGGPARGLHGEAYRGHILWDELFIFPFLNLHIPDLTRSLLMYRYRRLPQAKHDALDAGFKGAMFPWQSGSDGREESQTIHLNPVSKRRVPDNSHLQRHVGLAIAYNVWSYYQISRDIDFLTFYGVEMMIEISRFFASLASYSKAKKRYVIEGVMGPDEFHDAYPESKEAGLKNNAYTNIMVVWVLCRTLDALGQIPEIRLRPLLERLGLEKRELRRWEEISRKMFVPFHQGIINQFEGYERLKEFDWEKYRKRYKNIQRLDRILEAEHDSPNNYKLSKQADVLMLFYLLSSDELKEIFVRLKYKFKTDTFEKNVEYYVKRTSHGSTLSRIVHSWVLARVNREGSWQLCKEALESDLSDIQGGTTAEGIHL